MPTPLSQPAPEGTGLLTINETATWLRVDRATVYRLIQAQKLKPVIVGKRLRMRRTDLEKFAARRAA